MDHILGNKAVFKSTTDIRGQRGADRRAGDRGGEQRDRTTQEVGLGIALAGPGQQSGLGRDGAGGGHAVLGQPAALPELRERAAAARAARGHHPIS
jgi:hypothetical protein